LDIMGRNRRRVVRILEKKQTRDAYAEGGEGEKQFESLIPYDHPKSRTTRSRLPKGKKRPRRLNDVAK